MNDIFIAFSARGGIISRLIRWLTGGRVSHAAVLYRSVTWGGLWVAEATSAGVHTYPLTNPKIWVSVWRVKYDITADMRVARAYFGEHYDFLGVLRFGFILMWWRIFKRKLRRPLTASSGQFCSEWVAHVLRSVIGGLDPQWASPESLLKVIETASDKFDKTDIVEAAKN